MTDNVRHFAPERLAESGLLVQTADEFLIHQWWLDPDGVTEELVSMASAKSRPALTVEQVLDSLARSTPEFAGLVNDRGSSGGEGLG